MTLIKCPACDGHGKTCLGELQEQVFAVVPRRKSITPKAVAEKLGIEHAAACHRLSELLLLDLVTCERDGKFRNYTRK